MATAGWSYGVVPKVLLLEVPDDIRQRCSERWEGLGGGVCGDLECDRPRFASTALAAPKVIVRFPLVPAAQAYGRVAAGNGGRVYSLRRPRRMARRNREREYESG